MAENKVIYKKDKIHNLYKFPLGITVSFKTQTLGNKTDLISLSNIPAINHFNWFDIKEERVLEIIEIILVFIITNPNTRTNIHISTRFEFTDIELSLVEKLINRYEH